MSDNQGKATASLGGASSIQPQTRNRRRSLVVNIVWGISIVLVFFLIPAAAVYSGTELMIGIAIGFNLVNFVVVDTLLEKYLAGYKSNRLVQGAAGIITLLIMLPLTMDSHCSWGWNCKPVHHGQVQHHAK